ncbi:uncharacterized protein C10orf82 homolog isoform X2 [Tachyglossus aculeatus]|nr:uncharacterized protein C10orf82 homolog isoform X2 [Tachyglossus aculeatus]
MEENSKPFIRSIPIPPGYSGYIPLIQHLVGNNFAEDTEHCLETFHRATQRRKDQLEELRHIAATSPKHQAVCSHESVLRAIHDYYHLHHPMLLETKEMKRPLPESPIPGWTGYLPRANVTELGLGVRYQVMAKNCYKDFLELTERAKKAPLKPFQK